MGLCFRLPNNREYIERHGGVVIATNTAKDIIITLLPTGELHGFPVTAPVYSVVRAHSQDVMSALQKDGIDDGQYSLLKSRQVLSDFEQNGIIIKVGDFNYHSKDVEQLILGYPKEISTTIAGLGAAIEKESTFFDELDEFDEFDESEIDNSLSEKEDDGFDYNSPVVDKFLQEQKETQPITEEIDIKESTEVSTCLPMRPKLADPIEFTQGGEVSFQYFLSSFVGALNKFAGQITIQETSPGNITMLINSTVLPEITFSGSIKEMADEFMPAFIDVISKKKSDLNFIASFERMIDKKKEETTEKAMAKKKPTATKPKDEEVKEEDKTQKALF